MENFASWSIAAKDAIHVVPVISGAIHARQKIESV